MRHDPITGSPIDDDDVELSDPRADIDAVYGPDIPLELRRTRRRLRTCKPKPIIEASEDKSHLEVLLSTESPIAISQPEIYEVDNAPALQEQGVDEEQEEEDRTSYVSEPEPPAPDGMDDVRKACTLALAGARRATDMGERTKALDMWLRLRKMLGDNSNKPIELRPEWERFLASLRADGLIS